MERQLSGLAFCFQKLFRNSGETSKDRPDLLKKFQFPSPLTLCKRIPKYHEFYRLFKERNCVLETDDIDCFTEKGIKAGLRVVHSDFSATLILAENPKRLKLVLNMNSTSLFSVLGSICSTIRILKSSVVMATQFEKTGMKASPTPTTAAKFQKCRITL